MLFFHFTGETVAAVAAEHHLHNQAKSSNVGADDRLKAQQVPVVEQPVVAVAPNARELGAGNAAMARTGINSTGSTTITY